MTSPRQSALEAVAEAARKVLDAARFNPGASWAIGINRATIVNVQETLAALDALGPADTDDEWRAIAEARIGFGSGNDVQLTNGWRQWVGCRVYIDGKDGWMIDGNKWVEPTHFKPLGQLPAPPQRAQEGEG